LQEALWIKILVVAGLVDDAQQAALLSAGVAKRDIDFSLF